MTKKTESIQIPAISIKKLSVKIVGDTPLIHHRWDEKAKKMMLDKMTKKAKQAKEAKNPAREFAQATYIYDEQEGQRERMIDGDFDGTRWGFPSCAFRAAAINAARFADLKMTEARGAFFVVGDMVEIESEPPEMREDMVRIQMTTDIRYRPEFRNWSANLNLEYNANAFSVEQIVNLINIAGFSIGIGEWRPEKNGQNGRFHVATGEE